MCSQLRRTLVPPVIQEGLLDILRLELPLVSVISVKDLIPSVTVTQIGIIELRT